MRPDRPAARAWAPGGMVLIALGVAACARPPEAPPKERPAERAGTQYAANPAERVAAALHREDGTAEVRVRAIGDRVCLSGFVDSFGRKNRAGDLARAVAGATVENRLAVRHASGVERGPLAGSRIWL